MTERGLKNINVFYSTFTNVFLFLSRFFTFFNVFLFFFLERFFTSMLYSSVVHCRYSKYFQILPFYKYTTDYLNTEYLVRRPILIQKSLFI